MVLLSSSLRVLPVLLLLSVLPRWGWCWGNHSLLSYRALEVLPEVADAAPVQVETLEAFLRATAVPLAEELLAQERWAIANRPGHPVRPRRWAWPAPAESGALSEPRLRASFLAALRVSPQARFALFRQPDPRRERVPPAQWLPFTAVSPIQPSKGSTQRFVALQPGEWVTALAVVATASDEPDYGLDLNLFDDNPGGMAQGYGFGRQPFGNPAVSYSSQAPFHMGFFHQGTVFNTLAKGLTYSLAPLRVQQYAGLSALAFRTGHGYWGWRFLGMALHYVQDLTQPYHASAAPGEGLGHLVWVNLLDQMGFPTGKREMVVLQSNRHIVLEQIQADMVSDAALAHTEGPLEAALHDRQGDRQQPPWHAEYLRDVVAAQAHAAGPLIDALLVRTLPAHFVSDPGYDFAASDDVPALLSAWARQPAPLRDELTTAIAALMARLGEHSRVATAGMRAAGRP